MARVIGPLHSLEAHGTIADCLCFKRDSRGTIARKWAKPGGQPSIAQLAVRAFTKERMQHWPSISAEDKATWDELATQLNVTPINVYLEKNWEWHRLGLDLCDVYPYQSASPVYTVLATDPTESILASDWTATFVGGGEMVYTPTEIKTTSPENLTVFENASEIAYDLFFDFSDCPNLTRLVLNTTMITLLPMYTTMASMIYMDFRYSAMTSSIDLDALLIALWLTHTLPDGDFLLYGMGMAVPTAVSLEARNGLVADGWNLELE